MSTIDASFTSSTDSPRAAIRRSKTLLNLAAAGIGLLASTVTGWAQSPLKVAVMPSYTQNVTYANAQVNTGLSVWGRTWGGTGPYTYVLDYGDGTSTNGNVTDPKFIGASHTYTSGGLKTMSLTVSDSLGATASRTAIIRVLPTPTLGERSNMAIEKALVWLYRNQTVSGEKAFWHSTDEYGIGSTGATLLSFEENGHLPGNDYTADIYAETVQRGLNQLVSMANYQNISAQAGGNPDTNGNGKGMYVGSTVYPHCFALLPMIMAYPTVAQAQAAVVPPGMGAAAGKSFHEVATDMMDTLYWCQSETTRTGWYYYINQADSGGADGSTHQWPNIVMLAAKDRWGLNPPAWIVSRSVAAFKSLQNANGACGYSSNTEWLNTAKTGGMLAGYFLGGKLVGDADVNSGINYISSSWSSTTNGQSGTTGWAGQWYGMYGTKKGLQLQEVTTLTTPIGARDWKQDFTAWLLGDASLLHASIAPGIRNTSNMFGQLPDGRWSSVIWPANTSYPALDTAHGVLILSQAVTKPLPVAVIAAVGEQSTRFPAFQVDGSDSYHLDPNHSVVEYLWDWNAANGVNWSNPDATGPRPTNPGYLTPGVYTVTLMVRDNSDPQLVATTTAQVTVVDADVRPVAVAILAGNPAYAGKFNESILLDGTSSFDPDSDPITLYSWDINGDGIYGDATGATTSVSFAQAHTGQVGLRVTANGKTSTNNSYVDIYASANDIAVTEVSVLSVVPKTSANLRVSLKSDANSVAANFTGVVVRFFNGNPFTHGTQLGGSYNVNLPRGTTVTLDATVAGFGAAESVYVYVDANQAIPEWNELNNVGSVGVLPLLANGDFTAGDTGFTSGHTVPETTPGTPGSYVVDTNPQDLDPSLGSFGDHTSGNGNMMIIKSGGPQAFVYEQTVNVTPNTWYKLTFWGASASPVNPAVLTTSVNGDVLGETLALSAVVGEWKQFTAFWFSGSATSGTFRILDSRPETVGNAFAIDDLMLMVVPAAGSPVTTVVAAKGTPVPGAGVDSRIPAGAVFNQFGTPAINRAGQYAFYATWRATGSSGAGIFAGNPLALVVAKGDTAVGGPEGSVFRTFRDPVLSEEGRIAFLATLSGGGATRADNLGLWTNALNEEGDLELLARHMGAVPGVPDAQFKLFSSVTLQGREVLLGALLAVGPGGVTFDDDRGVWAYRAGQAPVALVREGSLLGGKTVKRFKFLNIVTGSQGHGRFQTREVEPGSGHYHAFHVQYTDGTQSIVGDSGVPAAAPMLSSGDEPAELSGAKFYSFGVPGFGGDGDWGYVYSASLRRGVGGVSSSNYIGIFQGAGNLVARKGDDAPGAQGAKFAGFKDPVGNSQYESAFLADLGGATRDTSRGIWWSDYIPELEGSELKLSARRGSVPPGAPGTYWTSFSSLALPGGGTGPVFVARVLGNQSPVNRLNDTGAWATDHLGTLHMIVREGNLVAGKVVRTFSFLSKVVGSPAQGRSYNDEGQFIYRSYFADGTQAILKVQMP